MTLQGCKALMLSLLLFSAVDVLCSVPMVVQSGRIWDMHASSSHVPISMITGKALKVDGVTRYLGVQTMETHLLSENHSNACPQLQEGRLPFRQEEWAECYMMH